MTITLTWARRTLKAVEETIKKYKKDDKLELDCPLCKSARGTDMLTRDVCYRCPWLIFKKVNCLDYKIRNGFKGRGLMGFRGHMKLIIPNHALTPEEKAELVEYNKKVEVMTQFVAGCKMRSIDLYMVFAKTYCTSDYRGER